MPTAEDLTGGHLSLAYGPGLFYEPTGLLSQGVIVAGPNNIWLRDMTFVNEGAAKIWVMLFDSTTLPSNGTSPVLIPIPLYPNQDATWPLRPARQFVDGVYWAASSTAGTLTYASSATVSVTMSY